MPDIPILVISCDKYADLWRPFFALFRRYWPDCGRRVFLGSNHRVCHEPNVTGLTIGEDQSWSLSVRRMLERVDSSHVILFLEDFFLRSPVETNRIGRLLQMAVSEDVGCLRLVRNPGPTSVLPGNSEVGLLQPGDDYRVSTQVAVWQTELLYKLLHPSFSAWDFEFQGSVLSDSMPDRLWGVNRGALDYRHAVERGKWLPQGLEICRTAGIVPDLQARPAMTDEELSRRERANYKNRIAELLPRGIRRRLWPRPDVSKL